MGKLTPHFFLPPFFLSSTPLPSPIKKRELRGHNSSKASLFDPYAVLSSVFSIQLMWIGISGVDRLSAQRDKSPPANCPHIKIKTDTPNRSPQIDRGGEGRKGAVSYSLTLITFLYLLNIS